MSCKGLENIGGIIMIKSKKEKKPDIQHYEGKNVNLKTFSNGIEKWFKERNFATQSMQAENKWLVQARKQGVWRTVSASARAFSIFIEGTPNDFSVKIGTGKWINNATSLAVITILSGTVLLPFCGIATAWSKKIKSDLKAFIDLTIDFVEKAIENELN